MRKYMVISYVIILSAGIIITSQSKPKKIKKHNIGTPFIRDSKMRVAKDKLPLRVQSPGDAGFHMKALDMLRKSDPLGYKVYQETKPEFFNRWLDPGDKTYFLTTAVHESVHGISGSRSEASANYGEDWNSYYFYLPDHTYRKVDGAKKFFYRDKIGRYLTGSERDGYYDAYLTGDCGQQDLPVLLDEVNAYTFDVYCGVYYINYQPDVWSSTRDGLATFMHYLQLYLYHARTVETAAYARLKDDGEYLSAIKALWENAEDALWKSAPYEQLGIEDKVKLKKVYSKEYLDEVTMLFEGSGQQVAFKEGLMKKLGYE